jgi:hypothetical protein
VVKIRSRASMFPNEVFMVGSLLMRLRVRAVSGLAIDI